MLSFGNLRTALFVLITGVVYVILLQTIQRPRCSFKNEQVQQKRARKEEVGKKSSLARKEEVGKKSSLLG